MPISFTVLSTNSGMLIRNRSVDLFVKYSHSRYECATAETKMSVSKNPSRLLLKGESISQTRPAPHIISRPIQKVLRTEIHGLGLGLKTYIPISKARASPAIKIPLIIVIVFRKPALNIAQGALHDHILYWLMRCKISCFSLG